MDYKKTNAPTNTITRDMMELCEDTGNVYETVAIIGKRSNQIAAEMKSDLSKKLQEFASYSDNLEEVFEKEFFQGVSGSSVSEIRFSSSTISGVRLSSPSSS